MTWSYRIFFLVFDLSPHSLVSMVQVGYGTILVLEFPCHTGNTWYRYVARTNRYPLHLDSYESSVIYTNGKQCTKSTFFFVLLPMDPNTDQDPQVIEPGSWYVRYPQPCYTIQTC
jgi:hypothetical protein